MHLRSFAIAAILFSSTTVHADDGQDFAADAQLFYRVVACGNTAPLPASFDAAMTKVVDDHCKDLGKRIATFQDKYIHVAQPFLAALRPADLPQTVVYPFGGGDLVSALLSYPDAREITTMSLEHPGDPTRLAHQDAKSLRRDLSLFRDVFGQFLVNHDSASENMMKMEHGAVPGQLGFFITGAALMGYEPVSLRYFNLGADGSVHYLTTAEVTALAPKKARRTKGSWVDTDYSEAFTFMEFRFRKAGDANAPVITHRHFSADLSNSKFVGSPLEKYLLARGSVVAMTKAASYLLWNSNFSGIRDFLLSHMTFMFSDSTGIPPRFAKKAGFTQTTFGRFTGSYLDADPEVSDAFVKLWSGQKAQKLPFRYGYPDIAGNVHMMITKPVAK